MTWILYDYGRHLIWHIQTGVRTCLEANRGAFKCMSGNATSVSNFIALLDVSNKTDWSKVDEENKSVSDRIRTKLYKSFVLVQVETFLFRHLVRIEVDPGGVEEGYYARSSKYIRLFSLWKRVCN